MKRNAIARIIIYSIVAFVLIGILVVSLAPEFFMYHFGDHTVTDVPAEGHVTATVRKLEIDWAAGSVTIRRGTDDRIHFYESAPDGCWYQMDYEIDGDTLSIMYSITPIGIGFGNHSMPKKDLVIQVPQDWTCEELKLDGAALNIHIENLTVENLDIDGAACNIAFGGSVDQVEIDGASCDITLYCNNEISVINIDGASCSLNLNLPKDCGFALSMDGLSCKLETELSAVTAGDTTIYGDGHCMIDVDGISCYVTIREIE